MDISVKKKPTRIFRFNSKKWLLFASLLENGYSMEHTLTLMNVKSTEINHYLQEGKQIQDLLIQGQKGAFYDHLSFFIQFMSISNAIYCSFQMHRFEKEGLQTIKKKCSYPIFVLCISFVSVYLFSKFVIPQILMNFENTNENVFIHVLKIIEMASLYFFILILFLCIVLLFTKINERFMHVLLRRIVPYLSIMKGYISYCLSGYMKALHTKGLSSKLAFEYLRNLKTNKVLAYIINEMTIQLNNGEDLCEILLNCPYLDNDFKMYFSIGYHNANSNESLQSYIDCMEIKWEQYISYFSMIVQMIAYSFVGLLLICVYQILLVPLEMLESL